MRYIKLLLAGTLLAFIISACSKEDLSDTPGSNLKMSNVMINKTVAVYDEANQAFDVLIPGEVDFSSVDFFFTSDAPTILVDGEKFVYGSRINASKPVTVTLVDGEERKSYKLTVHNSGLPVVKIDTPQHIQIKSKEEWIAETHMTIYDKDGNLDYDGSMSIKGRGNSTWNYPKKPYALKLDEKSKILSMHSNKRWVLLANWKDRTLLRNDAAFWLSECAGMEYTVKGKFVELVLNGEHKGNYYLCEQIKIGKNRVPIEEMAPMETDPELIQGGYIFELDTYFDEPLKFYSYYIGLPYQIKEPDEDEISPEAFEYAKSFISDVEYTLTDQKMIENHDYEEYLDVDSAIEFLLVQELTGNEDFYSTWPMNGPHSCYLYKGRGGKLMHGPVWDFDYHTFMPSRTTWWQGATRTMYYPYLLKDEKFKARLIEVWNQKKNDFKGLSAYLDEMTSYLSLSAGANHRMWSLEGQTQNKDESLSFQAAVARMKEGFEAKWDWMDKNISKLTIK